MMTRYPCYVRSDATRSHSSKMPYGKDSTADVEQSFGEPQDETQVPVAASSSQMLVQSPRASRSQHYEVPPGRRPSQLSREDRSDYRARVRRKRERDSRHSRELARDCVIIVLLMALFLLLILFLASRGYFGGTICDKIWVSRAHQIATL
nr:uncharacterized protein LOC126516426 [Dermacentor andersoni]